MEQSLQYEIQPEATLWFAYNAMKAVDAELSKKVHMNPQDREMLVAAPFAKLHILLDAPPGVGKTTMSKALATSIGGEFKRIQGAPDNMPSDITGGLVYVQSTGQLEFREGPVFANVVLVDESNRNTEKTQAALIEPMEEKTVTVDGVTYELPEPHIVILTQNPKGHDQGTFNLPNQIIDRIGISLTFPSYSAEQMVAISGLAGKTAKAVPFLGGPKGMVLAQEAVQEITVSGQHQHMAGKIQENLRSVDIVDNDESVLGGARPFLSIINLAKAVALMRSPVVEREERNGTTKRIVTPSESVEPKDIELAARYVLPHRFSLNWDKEEKQTPKSQAIGEAIAKAKVDAKIPVDPEL